MNIRETKSILALATPLVIGQLSQMLLGVVDTIMVGKVGVVELAALSFANSLFIIPFIFGIGVLTAISIQTASARGKQNPSIAQNICLNGFYLSGLIGVLLFIGMLLLYPFLGHLKQPPEVVTASRGYYLIIMASLVPCLISLGLKSSADALDRPWPAFWIFMMGVGLNILLNHVLIFGNWGFPELGLEGAAISTLISRCAIIAGMLLWFECDVSLRRWIPPSWFKKPDIATWRSLIKLGLPAGLQTLAEVSTFAIAGLLIGVFGVDALAAHQIALQASGMTFMIPLGISMALTVRMSETARQPERWRHIVLTGWVLTACCSLITTYLFIFGGTFVSSLFVDSTQLIKIAASLLFVSGIFQLVDGLQIASTGMLRGLHDTKGAAYIAVFSYWVIGIPIGYLLAHHFGLKAQGIWWGIAIGFGCASVLLSARLWKKTRLSTQTCAPQIDP